MMTDDGVNEAETAPKIDTQRAQSVAKAFPVDVVCPLCAAAVGRECLTRGASPRTTHRQRWKAIGIDKPTGEQLAAEGLDLRVRRTSGWHNAINRLLSFTPTPIAAPDGGNT